MGQYRLGIIGGMGPKATAVFYDRIVERTKATSDQEHLDLIILNHATLPDRTEAILHGEKHSFLQAIKGDLALLEQAGVANIAVPCNTFHYFYDDVQAMTRIPIIHMINETVSEIYKTYGANAKVGLLATKGTIQSGIYKKSCEQYNIELYIPDEVLQDQTMNIIYQQVKGTGNADGTELEELIQHLLTEQGCSCVIIGCTELSTIPLRHEVAKYCFDAMDILVRRSIERSGKTQKEMPCT